MLGRFPRWAPSGDAVRACGYGGLPEGLPAERWPVCAQCGVPMSLLLRFAAGPWLPRLPEGSVLFVFKCEGEDICDFWDSTLGANACLLLAAGELTSETPAAPSGARVLAPLAVTEWVEEDDGVPTSAAADLCDRARWLGLPDAWTSPYGFDSEHATKTGGLPYWTGNGPSQDPPAPRALLVQVDNFLTVQAPPAVLTAHLEATGTAEAYVDAHAEDPDRAVLEAANFMTDGIAYVFDVAPDAPVPIPVLTLSR